MAKQDIVERLRNGKPEVYASIPELRKWADWYVSCACGNVPDEAAAAYLLIEEFNRIDAALTEERSVYIMAHGIFQTEALRSKNEIDKLTTEIASLRQQLAEAREMNGWIDVTERLPGERGSDSDDVAVFLNGHCGLLDHEARQGGGWGYRTGFYDAGRQCFRVHGQLDRFVTHWQPLPEPPATAIRALPHPDREGERPSEAETAARIVDTQAQYYAGHNDDIAKAPREAAGAIRAQSQPRPGREGERG